MKIETWPISKLIKIEAPFNFTFGPIPKILFESIREIGITHPPQILQTDNGKTILITGKRRIEILHQLGPAKKRRGSPKGRPSQAVFVKIFSPKEISNLEAFHLDLFENLAIRKLNAIEKSNALLILNQELKIPLQTVQNEYLAYLELPRKEETVSEYLELQKLDSSAKELVSQGVIQVDTALKLLKFEIKDRSLITNLIQDLHLGVNSQKTLVTLAWEIFKKKGTPFSQLIHQEALKEILGEDKWTSSQKWAKLEGELKKQRYPILSELEERFKNIKAQLKLPPDLMLQNPSYFETSDYELRFRFKNIQEFENHLKTLKGLESKKALLELFKLTGEKEKTGPRTEQ